MADEKGSGHVARPHCEFGNEHRVFSRNLTAQRLEKEQYAARFL